MTTATRNPLIKFTTFWLTGVALTSAWRGLRHGPRILRPRAEAVASTHSVTATGPVYAPARPASLSSRSGSQAGSQTGSQAARATHGNIFQASWALIKETFSEWSADKAPMQSAALSYYTIFSIAPLFLVIIALVGLIYGREAAQGALMGQITNLVGAQSAGMIQQMIQHVSKPSANIIATAVGLVTLLLGAGAVFAHLQEMLNTAWNVEPKPGRGIMAMVRERFLSFAMILVIGFLLLVSLVLSAVLSAVGQYLSNLVPGMAIIGRVLDLLVSFGVITLLFAMIYKVLPDAKVAWSDVWIGALVTSLLFTLGKFLIGLYLGRSGVSSAYGAAGSLVIILLWVYYAAQILFFGAEFTQVYARHYGSRIRPEEHAQFREASAKEAARQPNHPPRPARA